MTFSNSYQAIKSYGIFNELVYQRGLIILQEQESSYCERYRTCKTLMLKPRETLKECNPLLSGKFNRFVDLLESLYEIGYYWKRLTETARLLEVNVPETPLKQMDEASWFIYNLDSYWHVAYGLEERLIKFLTIFKRMYKSPNSEELKILEVFTKATKTLKMEGAKKVRNPLAHFRSQGVQGWRNDHQWEAALLRNDNSDVIEIYDKNYLQHKDFYLGYVRMWVPQHSEMLSIMFDRLSTFSLERLEL